MTDDLNALNTLINVNGDNVQALEILFLTTMIALLPMMVIMMTCFARFQISLSFLRTAMGTQQVPPNLLLTGLALFLTLFTMSPVIDEISADAYTPYVNEEISQTEFLNRAQVPLKRFMLNNMEQSALGMFCDLAGEETPETVEEGMDLSIRVITPAFVTGELRRAFQIGLYLYIPFLLVDIIVASTLMSMGMVMLPPAMISTPFKLMLFVTLNGWELLFSTLIHTIH